MCGLSYGEVFVWFPKVKSFKDVWNFSELGSLTFSVYEEKFVRGLKGVWSVNLFSTYRVMKEL